MEQILQLPIREHLVVKEFFTPNDFTIKYHAYKGTALGLAHTLKQSLWLRPANSNSKVKGLYYAGQYTNPGVGVPIALVSAQLVAEMIVNKYKLPSRKLSFARQTVGFSELHQTS
ncbi:MAG: FAD-dependent oxidoreductase [Patescibacteria group bacterium]